MTKLTRDEAIELERLIIAVTNAANREGVAAATYEYNDEPEYQRAAEFADQEMTAAIVAIHKWQLDHGLTAVLRERYRDDQPISNP